MKFFGHPVHVMLIHFPTALLPMDFILSFLSYYKNEATYQSAAFYALIGGVATGYITMATGLIDLLSVARENKMALGTGLIHGFINGLIILIYTVFAYKAWQSYPHLNKPDVVLLLIKGFLVLTLLVGNYIGGQLIYKHRIGIK